VAGQPETCVIVGAGHAGGCAARALREAGFAGRIRLVGAEPSLPYERPPLSKDLLTGAMQPDQLLVNPPQFYDEAGIEVLRSATAVSVVTGDRTVLLYDGRAIKYDRLLLTTGARPRRLPIPGADLPGVHYLRTLEDALALRARLTAAAHVAVVGGGLIGLEIAASARTMGARVTVIEAASHLMGRVLPPAIARVVESRHRGRGVEIVLNNQVSRIAPGVGDRLHVTFGTSEIDVDLVVVGIGIEPNVELARAAGLTIGDGIVVDAFCESSVPGVYAAGDAACCIHPLSGGLLRQESWQNALAQGQAAARSMCGLREPYADLPYSWSQQFDMNIQVAGVFDGADESVLRGRYDQDGFLSFFLRQRKLVGAIALNRPKELRIAQHLISRQADVADFDLGNEGVSLKAALALRPDTMTAARS
jgi:3-phenylpropionate/trans-cinnamate dioxygenase ferredoxin reductase subunit